MHIDRRVRAGVAACLLSLTAVGPAAAAEPVPTSTVEEYVQDVVQSGVPGIAVAVIEEDRVLHTAAAGTDGHGGPMTTDTPMRIESLSKSFTALAVMQLVEDGAVDLDRPVRRYLPEFTLDDPRQDEITVRHLLSQTSAMADEAAPDLYDTGTSSLTEAVARLRTAHLVSDPGTQFHYHNPNYAVAARLVEKVSGAPFADYLDEHVFRPLGMRSTADTRTANRRVPGMAGGHTMVYGQPVRSEGPDYFTEGSGGVVSTADDMARWLVLQNSGGGRLVSPESIAEMHTPQPNADGNGLGWYHAESAEGPPVRTSHSGAGASFGAYQGLFTASGYGVVVLVNHGAGLTSAAPGVLGQNLLHAVDPDIPTLSGNASGLRVDLVLTGLAALALALGVLGVVRAKRWARRRVGRARLVTAARLLPLVLIVGVVLSVPTLQLAATGRTAPYQLLFYVLPVGVGWLLASGAAAAVVFALRLVHYTRVRSADDVPQ